MKICLDDDVGKVAEFMERNLPARKLQAVADALAQLADLIWARHANARDFRAFDVEREGSSTNGVLADRSETRPIATESRSSTT
jgi:hypothetical protein